MKRYFYCLIMAVILGACTSKEKPEELHVNRGKVTLTADESFREIVEAQVAAYQGHYPDTEFDVVFVPEQKAIGFLLSDSSDLAVVSRELTPDEQTYFSNRKIEYKPATMALDAVVFIINKENNISEISTNEIRDILEGRSSDKQLVFDNSSSSNLNVLISKLNISDLKKDNIFAAKGTLDVFEHIKKNKNSIGVVGLNWISDSDDKKSVGLKESVKILGLKQTTGEILYPSLTTLLDHSYPFPKTIYLLTTQHRWGVAKGFVRFACSQIGQLVVEKMGLQPYYIIPKKYEMTPGPTYQAVE
jgi:phosphate transport system substrate-binding protein